MRNSVIILSILLFSIVSVKAQSINDIGKIVIGYDIQDSSSEDTKHVSEYLYNKVSHWIAQAGYSSSGITTFFICPDINVDEENIAEGGMKNVCVITGTLYLRVVQADNNIVFSSISLPFKESATKRETAIKNGIGNLQYQKIIPMLEEAKEKILQYYEHEKNNIFAQADILVRNGNYDAAIAHLMAIPSSMSETYQEALVKANSILDMQIRAYNDSILSVANSLLAQHDANSALESLCSYKDSFEDQNGKYRTMLAKAEKLITESELAAARERRRQYLDEKERQYHQWAMEEKEQNHRINMDNQQMAYKRQALRTGERLVSQKIATDERTAARVLASNERTNARRIDAAERLVSQNISAKERVETERIYAIKSIAANYYRSHQTRTIVVQHRY